MHVVIAAGFGPGGAGNQDHRVNSARTNAGNLLDSLRPTTDAGWSQLAATLALGGALAVAAAPELAVAGAAVAGTDLLSAALDAEFSGLIVESRASVSVLPETARTGLAELATFTPRQAGATLQLDATTSVTQVTGGAGKSALVFEGGNLSAIQNYFRQITGFTGDLSEALEPNAPTGSTIYSVKMPNGENVMLRDITSSIGDWTIQLPKSMKLSNGAHEIKFTGTR